MKIKINIFLGLFLTIMMVKAQEKINVLDRSYYGFEIETGDDGWWMQQPDNWSIVNNKGADGTQRSLKYTNATSFTGSKKAFGSSSISEMLINLKSGSYELKAMIWVASESTSISKIRVNFRTEGKNDVNVNLDVTSVVKDQWVEVKVPFTLSEPFENTNVRIVMDSSTGAVGTFYLDDLQLLVPASVIPKELAYTSKIETTKEKNLSLVAGVYDVSLQVWVANKTTIPSFYTQIVAPWHSTEWNLEEVAKGQWILLTKEVVISESVQEGTFQIFVPNFSEEGPYQGEFYVDDIMFKLKRAYSNPKFELKAIGETCLDKNNGQIHIDTETEGTYFVEFNQEKKTFTQAITITDLTPGEYRLKLGSMQTSVSNEYVLTVPEATLLEVNLSSLRNTTKIEIVQGTAPYTVYKNGEKVKQFYQPFFEIESQLGDLIEVETAVSCEGKQSNLDQLITIVPNPANQYFNISCPVGAQLSIFSTSGQLVKEIETQQARPRIELNKNLSGVYFVKISFGSKSVIKKLVVK
ncbi:T9SS type A sorting domain-containing protein [Ochrovirga pacifica]|uniref:T9SS type A sorting domain-containing protein n=1 Tax=Ochrovirga pacifica TaxID=1042376 RepID=UPI00025583A5|nr:T9SS type A sorting domain-containing protein [Ochrovirga pacifica]